METVRFWIPQALRIEVWTFEDVATMINTITPNCTAGRGVQSIDALTSPRCASVSGFSLHANTSVPAGDRQRLERLCRYCARPPLAIERLEPLSDGRLLYRFKRAWRDGTTHIVLTPLELLEKLSAIVPAPKTHLVRYSGILGPAAKWRPLIIPNAAAPPAESVPAIHSPCPAQIHTSARESSIAEAVSTTRHRRNYTWAERMKRVWTLDVLECPRCHHRLRILAAIHPPDATRRILECLGLPSRAPPRGPRPTPTLYPTGMVLKTIDPPGTDLCASPTRILILHPPLAALNRRACVPSSILPPYFTYKIHM